MTWSRMARMLQANDRATPSVIVRNISRTIETFDDVGQVLSILDKDGLEANNLAHLKAKKWIANMFNVFEDEIETYLVLHGDDLGDAIYYYDTGAETQKEYSIQSIKRLLELNCGRLDSKEYEMIKEALLNMSANERRWFIRYLVRKPRNGINKGLVTKILAQTFDKKLATTKKHLNTSSIANTVSYYEMGEEPPTILNHGTFVAPMLAKEVPMKKWARNKIVDYKYDGNRYQIHKENDSVMIFNRKGKLVTQQFPEIVNQIREYEISSCVLDGEIYPINQDGTPADHKLMGTRVHSKNVQEAMERVKVRWVIFDCLKLDEDTLMDLPYSERVERMQVLPDQAHRMEDGGDVLAFYNRAINDGFEGIIVKDATMPYEAGKRSLGWAKYKPPRIDLDVVITGAKYGEGNRSNVFATFEISVHSDTGFTSVGWVGTGFSESELVRLTGELRKNIIEYKNDCFYISPRVVLEVTADLVTRNASGSIGLRFPRCLRIRDDKFVSDINTLADVEAME